jgi:hypothetical protein
MTSHRNCDFFQILKFEYLESLPASYLAFWLIESFSPERYRDDKDIIKLAIRMLYAKANCPRLVDELVVKLWAMFGLEPDKSNVIKLERKNK